MNIRPFCQADEAAVVALWLQCELTRPWNDPRRDIQRKVRVQPHLFLVGVVGGSLVGTVMAGYEGHRGWINYLAVAPAHQGKGYGRLLMERAEQLLRAAGCPKINLQVRATNSKVIEFYRRIGYAVDDVVSMGKRLEHDQYTADPG
jgi:ribosomal protein S18 acetylase RimI-like enzyme